MPNTVALIPREKFATVVLEQGQVLASDFLPKFAEEMHRVFGPEAANASNNLRANLNRLQTAITDLFLAAGKGGLTEALNDATRQTAAFLRSSQDVAMSAGGALATGLRAAGAACDRSRPLAPRPPPTIGAVTAQVDAAIPSMQRYGEALSKLIAMVPELAKAVEAQGKLTQARALFDEGTLGAQRAYIKGEISQNDMVDRVAKLKDTYERATNRVSGFDDAQAKVDARLRSASIDAMDAQAGGGRGGAGRLR